jgi:hypothetical protein
MKNKSGSKYVLIYLVSLLLYFLIGCSISLVPSWTDTIKDGKSSPVTARYFLRFNKNEEPDYGLYSYLIFGSNSEGTRLTRLAAAKSYLNILPEIDSIDQSVQKKQINIFYTFLKHEYHEIARNNIPCRDYIRKWDSQKLTADCLLEIYDYERARRMLANLDLTGDGMYIISYFEPLGNTRVIDQKKLLVQDLTRLDDKMIETWILEFRRHITTNKEYWNTLTFRNIMLNYLAHVEKVKQMIPFIKFIGQALASESEPKNK